MRTPLLLILFLLLANYLQAQSLYEAVASENIALANTNSTIANAWSGFHNSANLAALSNTTVSVAFYNQYSLSGLTSAAIAVSHPIKNKHTIFLGIKHFGDELYNEQRVALSYGTQVGIIQIGATINYMQLLVQDFGKNQAISLDLGVTAQISEALKIGAHASNMSNTYSSKVYEQYLPIILNIGLNYQPTSFLFTNVEIEKQNNLPAYLKAGISYQLVKLFHLRLGLRSDTAESFYGFGIKFLRMKLDYAISNHPELGISNSMSLEYKISGK